MHRGLIYGALATTALLMACGSAGGDEDSDAAASTVAPSSASTSSPTPSSPTPGVGSGGVGATTVPPDVGSVVIGTAVAVVPGGDTFAEQSGDVERRPDGECLGHATLSGLEAGAVFTVRDLATSEVIGAGTIESTSAEQVGDELPPNWECRFHLRVELTRPAAEVGIQIEGLPEWPGTLDGGELRVVIPNEVTSPKEPGVDSTEVSSSTEVSPSTAVSPSTEISSSTEASLPAED